MSNVGIFWANEKLHCDADKPHFNLSRIIAKIAVFGAQKTYSWSYRSNAPNTSDRLVRLLESGGIIGPYFFGNKYYGTITISGDAYRSTITDVFEYVLHGIGVNDVWFKQDGETCHLSHATIDLLR